MLICLTWGCLFVSVGRTIVRGCPKKCQQFVEWGDVEIKCSPLSFPKKGFSELKFQGASVGENARFQCVCVFLGAFFWGFWICVLSPLEAFLLVVLHACCAFIIFVVFFLHICCFFGLHNRCHCTNKVIRESCSAFSLISCQTSLLDNFLCFSVIKFPFF